MNPNNLNIGIFYSGLGEIGGGEILVNYLGRSLNNKIYTLFKNIDYNHINIIDFKNFIDVSDNLPFFYKMFNLNNRAFDFFCWSNVNIIEFDNFDMILSCGDVSRAIVTPEHIPHVNYCLSPMRRIYDLWNYKKKKYHFLISNAVWFYDEFLRIWDKTIDYRVDYYLAISPIVRRRIWKYLKRNSKILYPPIEFNKYKINEVGDFYLYCSRLYDEKRPNEAIEACLKLNKKLVVIGSGPLERPLKEKYKNNKLIDIRGFVSEEEKIELMSSCKALIYPAIAEDFGIVPIEAFASGKPVICSNDGFPPLLIDKSRGIITDGSIDGICKGIEKMERDYNYSHEALREFAEKFDFKFFKERLIEYLKLFMEEFNEKL